MVHLGMEDNVAAPTNDSSEIQSDNKAEEKVPKVQYTIPGVLHYVQHEWAKFEMERAQWEVERAELQARIAFLQGERKGQENLKNDLVRRIKMLEYALKQERMKNHRLTHGSVDLDAVDSAVGEDPCIANQIPTEVDAITTQPNSNMSWREGRQLLRKYLQEIGYTDTILDVRSFRVRSLLGIGPDSTPNNQNLNNGEQQNSSSSSSSAGGGMNKNNLMDNSSSKDIGGSGGEQQSALMAARNFASGGLSKNVLSSKDQDDRDSDSEEEITVLNAKNSSKDATDYGDAEEEALAEFQFLSGDEANQLRQRSKDSNEGEDWGVDYSALNKKKEMYQKEAMTKKGHGRMPRAELQAMITALNDDQQPQSAGGNQTDGGGGSGGSGGGQRGGTGNDNSLPFLFADSVQEFDTAMGRLGLGDLSVLSGVDEADPVAHNVNLSAKDSLRKTWSVRYTLRSHFDSVRSMAFHPVEPILMTASEDATLKLWNLQKSTPDSSAAGGNGKKMTLHDLEPSCTFRGHSGPILCMCSSPTGEYVYTGSLDGTVRCWMLPSPNVDPYDNYDSSLLVETLRGHSDSIWSVAFHSSDNRLISASSDCTLKLWEPGLSQPLLRTFVADAAEGAPTSVDFVSTDPQQAVAAFSSSNAFVYDLETGKSVLSFENNYLATNGKINQILSHPTLPITITAHEDKIIRFFDNNTGKLVDSMVAHLDAVTCLSIDPNGLYLLSGSHDGSLRLWNLDSKTCLQEITAHRKKFDESVMAVAFHPSRPLIASAGADGLAKVFV